MRRPERFAEAIKEQISEVVGYELDDPRLLTVTVTEVKLAPNMRDAKVFVLINGSETAIVDAMKALHHAAPVVRSQVALNLNLRHAPAIHFIRDTVEEKANRIDAILEDLKNNGDLATEDR
jgi:ribosome-binding factor A